MTASGIGIVRISGPEAFRILAGIFKSGKTGRPAAPETWHGGTIHYGTITDGEKTLDECLVMFMRGPHTYTTEDTVEINCHGGPFVMGKILELVLSRGARMAEPGEFTRRAFLGGRIDLSEAEAVMDLISAKSEEALESSVRQLSGSLKNEVQSLRSTLLSALARIEAALDDPEHMSLEGYPEELDGKLAQLEARLNALLASFSEGRLIREGIRTVILGKPNAGKSSLLNVLAGEDRAIVTAVAGTTRDALEETVRLGSLVLCLTDTAGIRETADEVESIGVGRAKKLAGEADLILAVFDAGRPLDEDDKEILSLIEGKKAVVLLNKEDLPAKVDAFALSGLTAAPILSVSAKEGTGFDALRDTVTALFFSGGLHLQEEVMLTNGRHKDAASRALAAVGRVRTSIADGMPEDFFTIDLMDAYAALGEITGDAVGEDLVNEIFSKFCMGK